VGHQRAGDYAGAFELICRSDPAIVATVPRRWSSSRTPSLAFDQPIIVDVHRMIVDVASR